jgi:hypothetical protein
MFNRWRRVIWPNRGSRSASSGTYRVMGSSTEEMRPSPTAMPTRAPSTDLAIDIEVWIESGPAPLK